MVTTPSVAELEAIPAYRPTLGDTPYVCLERGWFATNPRGNQFGETVLNIGYSNPESPPLNGRNPHVQQA